MSISIQAGQVYRSHKSNSCWLVKKVESGKATLEELNNQVKKNIITRPVDELVAAVNTGTMERRRASIHETDI